MRVRRAALMLGIATAAVVVPVSSAAANVWYDSGWWYPQQSECLSNGDLAVQNMGVTAYACNPSGGGWELWFLD